MTKYRYRWPITIGVSFAMWAGIVYAVKADGIKEAAVYNIDQNICGLKIGDTWIVDSLYRATREYSIDAKTVVEAYTQATNELMNAIQERPYREVVAYCASRRAH